jgi:threonylcarbamoyladenosine tRNA methylthiotransferase MtaB
MRRRYTVEEYMDIVRTVRRHDPHYAITTDVIAGFPGESDSDFQETVEVIKAAGFLKVHAFPYSKRPLTDAASALEQVPSQVKKQRVKLLSEVADSASQAYIESLSGLALRVLPEEIAERRPGGIIWKGREDRYVAVYATSPNDDMPDGFQTITAGNSYADGLFERQEEIE